MNTPSHALINSAALGSRPASRLWPVLAGAVLPDAPIFLFYAWEKMALRTPELLIWTRDYDASAIQPLVDSLHSFPLILAALAASWRFKAERLKLFSASLLLHACEDFPLHHADAHRQFFPFSDFRFRSPLSYWDPRYHGAWGAALELSLAAACAWVLIRRHERPAARAAWAVVFALNLVPFLYW